MGGNQTQKHKSFSGFSMLLFMLISYFCQLFCCGYAAWGRALFISVSTSSQFPNDPKIVGADVITPNPMAVLLSRNLRMHFINDTRLSDRHSWELGIWGAWTWHHLETISCCFFCLWSSCRRLRCAAISSSQCPVSPRQACYLWMLADVAAVMGWRKQEQ